jgi:hypothetical protein
MLLMFHVYNHCDRQINMSLEQHEDWSTRRKAWPRTTLYIKNYLKSNTGLRDTAICEIFALKSVNHQKFSQKTFHQKMFPICGCGHNGSRFRNLFSFSLAVLDIPNVSEMYYHFTIISETEKARKVIFEGWRHQIITQCLRIYTSEIKHSSIINTRM